MYCSPPLPLWNPRSKYSLEKTIPANQPLTHPPAVPPYLPPPVGPSSFLHARLPGGPPVNPHQLDLPPDELRMHALAMLIEPVGIDEPGGVVVRVCEHRIQQSVSLGCCRHFASF